jgi:hypothetical protein
MNAFRLSLILIALVALAGCSTVMYDARTLDPDARLNDAGEEEYTVVSSFEINDKASWLLGIVPVNKPAGDHHDYLATLLNEEIRKVGGDAVINVKLRTQNRPLDVIVGIATLGVYAMRTATITGDVIKYR